MINPGRDSPGRRRNRRMRGKTGDMKEIEIGSVAAVCISREKGTRKQDVGDGFVIEDYGLRDDAHANSKTRRQVCLLAKEGIDRMVAQGYDVGPGDFAENITTTGIDLLALEIGTRLRLGDEVELVITQKGKECHDGCNVFRSIGICIAREEAIFGRVLRGGRVRAGDSIFLLP